jgi:site-specific DNA recombinase
VIGSADLFSVPYKAPYGYRYVPKRDGVPGHLVVDEEEAALVRLLFTWA